ncbi:hypothetical protein BT67DRAFT_480473 [Trichocladium antarcticum]|uniref:DUF4470 domain-containing protein n=1 Tax=Trichocladium antarcticum TaxID=1450529 RepID=A0AAN6ZBZ7_9PEZI|nr:hypothetical protein BT67DRAFT_480473 [Trichocladium antarcticum]
MKHSALHSSVSCDLVEPFQMGSFRPAVNLAEHLPQGVDADILLLGAGDARDILYTPYAERCFPKRNFDITTCENDENHIARNILLFSLILDGETTFLAMWEIYYHTDLTEANVKLVGAQTKKLAALSKTLQGWNAGPYAATLRFCDQKTLSLVRAVWIGYHSAPPKVNTRGKSLYNWHWRLAKSREIVLQGSKKAISRSCAPLSMQTADVLLAATRDKWDTHTSGRPVAANTADTKYYPNRVFALPLLAGPSVFKYPTNPMLAYHLAPAQAALAERSPFYNAAVTLLAGLETRDKLWALAELQFIEQIHTFKAAAPRMTVRFMAGDYFAFCYTLRHNLETGQTSAQWYRAQMTFDILELARSEYGNGGKAPRQFDSIDTYNSSDRTGTTNLLVAAGPLLKDAPSSTLYTEGMHKMGKPEWEYEQLLCGHTTAISILLGLVPMTVWTNATAVSPADEILASRPDASGKADPMQTRFMSRLAWKQSKHMSGQDISPLLRHGDLLRLTQKIYCKIFQRGHTGVQLSLEAQARLIQRKGWRAQHNTAGFSALLSAIGKRAQANLAELCIFLVQHAATTSGQDTYRHALFFGMSPDGPSLPELCVLDPPKRLARPPGFTQWTDIPMGVAVTFVVPTDRWQFAILECPREALMEAHLIATVDGVVNRSCYTDIHVAFGNVTAKGSPTKDNFTIAVQEDKDGWKGTSPMIVSFYVPTMVIRSGLPDAKVGIHYVPVDYEADGLEEPTFDVEYGFQASISDAKHVFITKFRPNQTAYQVTECALKGPDPGNKATTLATTKLRISANMQPASGNIASITELIVPSEAGKKLLAASAPITLHQTSPFKIDISLGTGPEALTLHATFPVPITTDNATVKHTPGFLELTAPLASPLTSPSLNTFLFPTTLSQTNNNNKTTTQTPVTMAALPNISLCTLPILNLNTSPPPAWLTTLASLTLTPRERLLRQASRATTDPTPRQSLKESLLGLFLLAAAGQGRGNGAAVFALTHADASRGGVQLVVVVGAVRLDGPHGSVVVDGAAVPLTREVVLGGGDECAEGGDGGGVGGFLARLGGAGRVVRVVVGEAELQLWKRCLPAWAERCREWEHRGGARVSMCVRGGCRWGWGMGSRCCVGAGWGGFPGSLWTCLGGRRWRGMPRGLRSVRCLLRGWWRSWCMWSR